MGHTQSHREGLAVAATAVADIERRDSYDSRRTSGEQTKADGARGLFVLASTVRTTRWDGVAYRAGECYLHYSRVEPELFPQRSQTRRN